MVTFKINVSPETIRDWLRRLGGRSPPIYWTVEKMTHRGGWERVARFEDEAPEPKPEDSIDPPARLRCVRRREGRIDAGGLEWTVEHPAAAERYRRLRARDRLVEGIQELGEADAGAARRFYGLYERLVDERGELGPENLEFLAGVVDELVDEAEAADDQDDGGDWGERVLRMAVTGELEEIDPGTIETLKGLAGAVYDDED